MAGKPQEELSELYALVIVASFSSVSFCFFPRKLS
jgi:hypothetical protein